MATEIESTNDDLQFKKKVGKLDVLISEQIHVSGDNQFEIEFDGLIMRFKFITDTSCKDTKYEKEIDNNILTLELTNFKKSLGEGILEPMSVGNYSGRILYFSFFIWTINEEKGLRIISYSFYLGEDYEE